MSNFNECLEYGKRLRVPDERNRWEQQPETLYNQLKRRLAPVGLKKPRETLGSKSTDSGRG